MESSTLLMRRRPGRKRLPLTAIESLRSVITRRLWRWLAWTQSQLAARELLTYANGVSNVDLIVEHEYPDARIQDPEKLKPILKGSVTFTRSIDQAAGDMYALHQVLESQNIKVQGVGREAYRS